MNKQKISWEKIDNGNYVRIDEIKGCDKGDKGSPLAICTRQMGYGRNKSFEVWVMRYEAGSCGDDGIYTFFETDDKSEALKYATAKRKEYLKLLRHMGVAK